jgi:hypothetical protein
MSILFEGYQKSDDEINAREIQTQDPLKGRHPLEPPVLIIRLRQITELYKHIDEAEVSLLLQQLGGDRAECSLKVLPIPRHGLCHSLSHLGFPCT